MKNKPKKSRKIHKYITNVFIGAALSLLMILFYIFQPAFLHQFENNVYDIYLRTAPREELSQDIIILDIDEASLAEYGQWPWPRYILAEIISRLSELGASAIGIDIIISEPDRTSPELIANSVIDGVTIDIPLNGVPEELRNYDIYLAKVLERTPSVLGFYIWSDGERTSYENKPRGLSVVTQALSGGSTDDIEFAQGISKNASANLPLEVLYKNRVTAGFTNAESGSDGILRAAPLVMELDGRIYPSLSLAVFMKAHNITSAVIKYENSDLLELQAGQYIVPLNAGAGIQIPFKGGSGSYKYFSAADLMENRLSVDAVNGKIVLIGSSAVALQDIKATPWDRHYPGVEVHAAIIDALSSGSFIKIPIHTPGIQALSILILGILSALMFGTLRPLIYLPVSGLLITAVTLFTYKLFTTGTYLSPVYMVLVVALQATVILGLRFWMEESHKRFIQSAFGKYVAPEVVDSIAKRDDDFLRGEKRELTILFSDIRGFTSLSEQLDPQQVVELLNEYFTPMTAIIRNSRGTIDKFIGDAIMAFWNAPLDVEEHASKALKSAMQMQEALEKMNQSIKERYGFTLSMGAGIHSGAVYVGNMGSQEMLNYTVIGDNVNTASRLEGLCKVYGVNIIISADTMALCGDVDFKFIFLDSIIVLGRKTALDIYTVLSVDEYIKNQDEIEIYNQFRHAYFRGNFEQAKELCMKLDLNKKLYHVYYDRICSLCENPPKEWDGVWKFNTK